MSATYSTTLLMKNLFSVLSKCWGTGGSKAACRNRGPLAVWLTVSGLAAFTTFHFVLLQMEHL